MKIYDSICILTVALLGVLPCSLSAQNLDPTVEVTREYEGKLMGADKPSLEMAVPDSVLRFDLDFDYAVYDNPYKGAYEFRPYELDMQPVRAPYRAGDLYMKVGAGFGPVALSVKPKFDMVWAPVARERFRMDVYAGHDSYFGRYLKAPAYDQETDVLQLREETGSGNYDMITKAGTDMRYDWDAGVFKADVGYLGIGERYGLRTDMFNSVKADVNLASKNQGGLFDYDVKASYSFGRDRLDYSDDAVHGLSEHCFGLSGRLDASLTEKHRMYFDIGIDEVIYTGEIESGLTRLVFAPHYMFRYGNLEVDAGFRIEPLLPSKDSLMFLSKGQFVYPDVSVAYHLIPGVMKAYALIGGGTEVNTFSSMLEDNHHLDLSFGRGGRLMDNTVETFSASLGIKGRAGADFSYDVRGGFAAYASALLEKVVVGISPEEDEVGFLPGVGYAPYRKAYAAADLLYDTGRFRAAGRVVYSSSWFKEGADRSGLFLPAALTGDVSLGYNWNKRVYIGADCGFSTGRYGDVMYPDAGLKTVRIPGYADLGVDFEYMASRSFSFWVRGGNLLNMAVQRDLLYAEKGVSIAVGICLNF